MLVALLVAPTAYGTAQPPDATAPGFHITDANDALVAAGSSYLLPDAVVGSRSAPQFFAIHNAGPTALEGLTIALRADASVAFQLTVGLPPTLAPGGIAYFALAFMPLDPGLHTATIDISGADPTALPFALTLSAEGRPVATATVAGVRLVPVAHSGMAAPDYVTGAAYKSFRDAPTLGYQQGDRVLLRSTVTTPAGDRDSFWRYEHSTAQITRALAGGDAVTGAPAEARLTTQPFINVVYGPNASLAVSTVLQGGGVTTADNRLIVGALGGQSGPVQLTRQGDAANISQWRLGSQVGGLTLANEFTLAFKSQFTGSGVDASNQDNIWTSNPSRPWARQGWQNDAVPGQTSSVYYTWFGGSVLGINAVPLIVFTASTVERNTTGTETRRLILRGAGQNRQITAADVTPPGLAANYRFALNQAGPVRVTGGTNPWVVFADNPRIPGTATVTSGIWRWRGGVLTEAIRNGTQLTLPEELQGQTITPTITRFAVNSAADVALITSRGLVIAFASGPIELRYRLGDRLPGMPELSGVTQFEDPTLSDGGGLAFVAHFTVGGAPRRGLWVETQRGGLRLVAQTGVPLAGSGFDDALVEFEFYAGGHSAAAGLDPTAPSAWYAAQNAADIDRVVFRSRDAKGRHAVWSAEPYAELIPPTIGVRNAAGVPLSRANADLDFAAVAVGSVAAPKRLIIQNEGEVPVDNLTVAIVGPHAADFRLEMDQPPGSEPEAMLTFAPRAAGVRYAVLRIAGSDPAGEFYVVLQGMGTSLYFDHVSAVGLSGEAAAPAAIPFGDGVPNLLKFAFNLNLAGPDNHTLTAGGNSGLPTGRIVEVNGQTYWRVEYVRRLDGGLTYTPEQSMSIDAHTFAALTGVQSVSEIHDAPQWERVVIDQPCDPAVATGYFCRVRVALP
jgi:hypothetical protein